MTEICHVLIFENDICEGCQGPKAIGIHGANNKLSIVMACDCDPQCAELIAKLSAREDCEHFCIVEDSATKTIADMLMVLPDPDVRISRSS